MKKVLILLSTMLLALSCSKMPDVPVVDLAKLTADYEARDGETLTGILGGNYKITISGGMVTALGGPSAAGIGSGYHAKCGNISISGGSVTSRGGEFAAGIGGGSGTDIDEDVDTETPSVCGNITISGGTVMASGNSILSAAGIGSGEGNATCGDILISGGTVTAEGEHEAAGIGTGARGSVGSITVTNGVTQVTVKKVSDSTPHSIGGGLDYKKLGTVTIGGKEGPVSESPFVYKP